ncbi:pyruvate, water dikinase regulatory protein [Microbacterium laevaniformans]|uniref:pyruvate, water dikinase regulatory protein n=1 Tax=Microbacterium laevaniformans TaxID=36807 RepID=UPI0019576CAD|nr:pyruvate, water dikinase regulatory protein [Microbacterium laevaniformans]MBM7753645.1 regulator of PEP synthase PpsR (kinase-PPPase family) [Microbacterium laevaniformans]GLJ64202.1 putative phosphoenolpyruvate synthase regulatory protein [Microbacterium laevaniformans]
MTPTTPRAAYFVSDSTGITAETLGRALLVNFPGVSFRHHTVPFVDSAEGAAAVAREIDRAADAGMQPIVFHTVRSPAVARTLGGARATHIDLLSGHLTELEAALGTTASEQLGSFHTVGDTEQYFARMRAVEYAIEHDDGQSMRALDQADVLIVAPSRCGKTPTTMYLALQYGLLVANYPLTDDDFPTEGLPRAIAPYAARCFGLTTTPLRLSQVRHERRPDSTYASLAQCTLELRRAEDLYRRTHIPFVNSSTKSVEEMSAVIMQSLKLRT